MLFGAVELNNPNRIRVQMDGAREMHRVSSSNSLISREVAPTRRNSNIRQDNHLDNNGAVPWIKTDMEVHNSLQEFPRSIMIRGGATLISKRSKEIGVL